MAQESACVNFKDILCDQVSTLLSRRYRQNLKKKCLKTGAKHQSQSTVTYKSKPRFYYTAAGVIWQYRCIKYDCSCCSLRDTESKSLTLVKPDHGRKQRRRR